MALEGSVRPSSDVTDTEYFNPSQSVPSAVYSLLDSVDSKSIADEYGIGKHSNKLRRPRQNRHP